MSRTWDVRPAVELRKGHLAHQEPPAPERIDSRLILRRLLALLWWPLDLLLRDTHELRASTVSRAWTDEQRRRELV